MSTQPVEWRIADRVLSTAGGTLIMGILNITPDSFSDGGDYLDVRSAIARGRELWEQGADIIDIGGESTRPGAPEVSIDDEMNRVIPVVAELAGSGMVVSIDTSKSEVAAAATAAGAAIINDVTALGDPRMAGVAAASGAGLVLMHMQGSPRTMQDSPRYDDVVSDVLGLLEQRAQVAEAAGVDTANICIDPGIGFGKTVPHNLTLLRNISVFVAGGRPVLVGPSRKSFLKALIGDQDRQARDEATGAAVALAIAGGAAAVRVHNVVVTQRVARVVDAIVRTEGKD